MRVAKVPLCHHHTNLKLTNEQITHLDEMEHWQFLSVQIWCHDVGNFVIALFEILVFIIAMVSMDFTKKTPPFLLEFAFECQLKTTSIWWIEKSIKSGTLWELHVIIVFMYTTLAIVVLSTIPYKYDRFMKTEKEIKKAEEVAKKKLQKKLKKKGKLVSQRS